VSKQLYLVFAVEGLKKHIWLCATYKAKFVTLAV